MEMASNELLPRSSAPYWQRAMITRDTLAFRIRDYLQQRMTRAALVDWAEHAVMEEEFDARDLDAIRDITSRLGLADVREFGLTWEDCEGSLSRLGYRTKWMSFKHAKHAFRGRRRHRGRGSHCDGTRCQTTQTATQTARRPAMA